MRSLTIVLTFLKVLITCHVLISVTGQSNVEQGQRVGERCGYESCAKTDPNLINVHIVAHTHDDVGWLKTVDQYFYGSKNHIQKAGVQYILDSVVASLLQDPAKKFIYVESAFFFKWWKEQTVEMQEQVKMLVSEGRLEFTGGAWSMNDEATTHYQSLVDQFTWGLKLLNDTFGGCGRPRVGWQIDPFGHSREMASLFAQMSYDGLFFGRLHYEDKSRRLREKEMEMIWRASNNLGESAEIFTGALYNTYSPPSGFCWDVLCSDEPFVDDKKSSEYNVDRLLDHFITHVHYQRQNFLTNNVIMTMGGDFTYQDANYYYKNLDKLIKYGNERQLTRGSKYNFIYSTPSCYLKSLKEANQTWPTYSEDFFPYASDSTAVWTGYFTSRPTVKRYERMGNHFLQICKQLTSLAILKNIVPQIDPQGNGSALQQHLTTLREEMGIMQHHDAVTGTEKQHVADDYIRNMHNALAGCNENAKLILNAMTRPTSDEFNPPPSAVDPETPRFEFESCHLLNISQCAISESGQPFMVTVYNPLAHATFQPIRIPVPHRNYRVRDYREVPVQIQFVPVPDRKLDLPFRNSPAAYEIVFLAQEIPGLGYKSYFFEPLSEISGNLPADGSVDEPKRDPIAEKIEIGNENVKAMFDSRTGLLTNVIVDNQVHNVKQEFFYYHGVGEFNRYSWTRASGAYILRPNGSEIHLPGQVGIKVIRGDIVDEVVQTFNDWISQVVRIYHDNSTHVEFEWTVGPIPVQDSIGKEIVSRFSSEIDSKGVFYTDSNGREMMKRTRNLRALYQEETVAQNYYPLNSRVFIEDQKSRMAILTDRAQGTASLKDGSIDVMLHRRLLHDDGFGVEEALNELQFNKGLIATGKLQLALSKQEERSPSSAATERFLEKQILLPNWVFFSNLHDTYEGWLKKYRNIASTLLLALPQNIYLMTLEPWREHSFLLRFEHVLESEEDEIYSKPITFDLIDVFGKLFDIEFIRETNLAGNQWLTDVERFKFTPRQEEKNNQPRAQRTDQSLGGFSSKYSITLRPMQIRTFVIGTRNTIV